MSCIFRVALSKRLCQTLRSTFISWGLIFADFADSTPSANDAALATHTEAALQRLVDRLAHACREFGLTISLKKTEVMSQGTESPPSIHIGDYDLNPVSQFQYLGSTIFFNLSLDPEISARIAKAAGMMSKLQKRVWDNNNLTNSTKMQVYRACVLSTLLYSSEAWTTYATHRRGSTAFTSVPSAHPGHPLARLGSQHLRARAGRTAVHFHPPGPASTEVARTCTPHGRQPHPERPTVW